MIDVETYCTFKNAKAKEEEEVEEVEAKYNF